MKTSNNRVTILLALPLLTMLFVTGCRVVQHTAEFNWHLLLAYAFVLLRGAFARRD